MSQIKLRGIANKVVRRAQHQGFVVPRDIRAELSEAGMAETLWKDVLELSRSSLRYRHGRYYFLPTGTANMRVRVHQEQAHLRTIRQAVRRLIRQYHSEYAARERRSRPRIDLIQPIQVQTEDRRVLNLLSRDISLNGVRLLGTYQLMGQKIRVWIPRPGKESETYCFLVQILWSAAVGDNLFENGGMFLELLPGVPDPPRLRD